MYTPQLICHFFCGWLNALGPDSTRDYDQIFPRVSEIKGSALRRISDEAGANYIQMIFFCRKIGPLPFIYYNLLCIYGGKKCVENIMESKQTYISILFFFCYRVQVRVYNKNMRLLLLYVLLLLLLLLYICIFQLVRRKIRQSRHRHGVSLFHINTSNSKRRCILICISLCFFSTILIICITCVSRFFISICIVTERILRGNT